MKRKRIRRCRCQAPLNARGVCPFGCSRPEYAKPALRAMSLNKKLCNRERSAPLGLPTRREVVVGAAKALSGARSTRGLGGDATNPATLEAELASGRW